MYPYAQSQWGRVVFVKKEMLAYLDAPYDRAGTDCLKWDALERFYGKPDLVAMWVADMDFPTAPQVRDAIVRRAEHAIYGYTLSEEKSRAAEVGWQARRHQCEIEPDWILYSPGVVDSIFLCVRALTEAGEGVVIQPPVYGPFYEAIEKFGRRLVEAPLIHEESGWRMDYEALDRAFEQAKLMILCSPHNPVGRVWTPEELEKVVALAEKHGATIVSDEIHADFVFDGRKQTRIFNVPGAKDRAILLTSPTKSFNLAGLRHSSMIIAEPALREKMKGELSRAHADANLFGSVAQIAAYTEGDEWMDAVVEYIQGNRDFAVQAIRERLPMLKCTPQEGTYLLWVDFRGLGMSHEQTQKWLVEKAGVALTEGTFFGKQGEGWFRINLATQRANVEKTIDRLVNAIQGR